jgi:anti-sigma B factor antagonist
MQAWHTMKDNRSVITLSGRIDFASRTALRALIDNSLTQGCSDFILDLQQVSFIDSSGLGALIACFSTVRKQGGSMALARVPKYVHDLMEMTRLTHFFEICDTVEAALQSHGQ